MQKNKQDIKIIDSRIKEIYYKYFYQKSKERSFKSFIFYSIVIQQVSKNPELFTFINSLKKVNKFQKDEYIINDINIFKFMTKWNDNLFDTFNIFLLLLKNCEEKEFFFNGTTDNSINTNLKFLVNCYQEKGYDLKKEDEFNKYNLIEIKDKRELHWQEPRVIDKMHKITFDIKYMNIKTYQKIFNLYSTNNFKFSFYPDCLNIKNYIDESIMTYDEKEFGKKYNIKNIETLTLNENIKFVDYKEENKLYVKVSNNELTFEEIQKEPNNFDGKDFIYTKVVHLIFEKEDSTLFINHLDLEYIFYSIDEYIERFDNNNFKQKGSKIKRQKIFKIDNAKIRMTEHLYDIVYNSLDNKTLINEYFEMLNISH